MKQYETISKVIKYISREQKNNKKNTPSLEDLARHVNLSQSHLQKVFVEWCGISPKQFSRFLTLNYAKSLLAESSNKNTNLGLSNKMKLSSTSRLHDLFLDIEAMTPNEYKNQGEGITINYSFQDSIFGNYIVASTRKGICSVLFCDSAQAGLSDLNSRFKNAKFIEKVDDTQKQIINFFGRKKITGRIKLHLHGTNFQIKVWQALLSIPEGSITSYGKIAKVLGDSKMSRAVGSAIGDNPIGYIIPCHRVLKSTGEISGYAWGVDRKRAMLGWEGAQRESE